MKSLRKDASGVSPLLHDSVCHSDSTEKANILNHQFQSVFTREDLASLPDKGDSPFPSMPEIGVDTNGVRKLLEGLNPHKASGPDAIPPRVLKEAASELAPALSHIFQRSLESGQVPTQWRRAYVTPVFKKGERYKAQNYRPVSLTCICSKVLEHIIVSNVMRHLDANDILVDHQHGFRGKRSCESQLLLFTQDLLENMDRGVQTDVVVMDFSKAFDKVPHQRLKIKLDHYGIRGHTQEWISNFLTDRGQQVLLDGAHWRRLMWSQGCPRVLSWAPSSSSYSSMICLMISLRLSDYLQMTASSIELYTVSKMCLCCSKI